MAAAHKPVLRHRVAVQTHNLVRVPAQRHHARAARVNPRVNQRHVPRRRADSHDVPAPPRRQRRQAQQRVARRARVDDRARRQIQRLQRVVQRRRVRHRRVVGVEDDARCRRGVRGHHAQRAARRDVDAGVHLPALCGRRGAWEELGGGAGRGLGWVPESDRAVGRRGQDAV